MTAMFCISRINTPVYAGNVSKTVRITKPIGKKSIIIATSKFRKTEPTVETSQYSSSGCNKRYSAPCSVTNPRVYVIYRDLMSAFHTLSVGETLSQFEDGWVFTKTTKTKGGFVIDFAIREGSSVTSGRFDGEKIQVSGDNIVPMRAFMDTKKAF
jgi:hypothetical protein